MDEILWRDGADPAAILDAIKGSADPRRLRLFACACCRQVWARLRDVRARRAVEAAERFADGEATAEELRAAYWRAAPPARVGDAPWACVWSATQRAMNAAAAAARG